MNQPLENLYESTTRDQPWLSLLKDSTRARTSLTTSVTSPKRTLGWYCGTDSALTADVETLGPTSNGVKGRGRQPVLLGRSPEALAVARSETLSRF